MIEVSVIIPVWNGANYLGEAIESVLAQDYPHKEVIVVNDGSTDSTQKIIEEFGKNIRSIVQENKGLGAARNTGIKASQGRHLSFLDHDDLWEKTKLSDQIRHLTSATCDDPLVFSYAEQFICPRLSEDEKNKIVLHKTRLPGYSAGTLLLSRIRFDEVGFFTENKQVGEFLEWYSRAMAKKIPVTLLDSIHLKRRVHLTNMGRQKVAYNRNDYLKILKVGLERRRAQE